MAGTEKKAPIKELKTTIFKKASKNKQQPFVDYDEDFDALMLVIVPREQETVVRYVSDHVGLLYLPDSLEIVGIQIEAFLHSFVPQHENVLRAWKSNEVSGQTKASIAKKPQVLSEVAKAAKNILGQSGEELVDMLA